MDSSPATLPQNALGSVHQVQRTGRSRFQVRAQGAKLRQHAKQDVVDQQKPQVPPGYPGAGMRQLFRQPGRFGPGIHGLMGQGDIRRFTRRQGHGQPVLSEQDPVLPDNLVCRVHSGLHGWVAPGPSKTRWMRS